MPPTTTKRKQEAERGFHETIDADGISPEGLLLAVVKGEESITVKGRPRKITAKMIKAAESLVPFRLPRLNSIDAVTRNVEMSHEEWIRSMDDSDDGGEG